MQIKQSDPVYIEIRSSKGNKIMLVDDVSGFSISVDQKVVFPETSISNLSNPIDNHLHIIVGNAVASFTKPPTDEQIEIIKNLVTAVNRK